MSGWDGAGNFTVPYTFAVDAANGVKIQSARQDTQWATVVAGLMNCQTRDGQNKPTADWNFNGKKLTNLGAPVSATDSARLGDIQANVGEWISETNSFAWVSASQFKITGVDRTSLYTQGRALKVIHNGGGTTSSNMFVASSSFSVDTTVTVGARSNTNQPLVSPITAVSYGVTAANNLSLPVPSAVFGFGSSAGINIASNTLYPLGVIPFLGSWVDTYGELNTTTGNFTPLFPGVYLIFGNVTFIRNGATYTGDGSLRAGSSTSFPITTAGSPNNYTGSITTIAYGSGAFSVVFNSPSFTGGPMQLTGWMFGFVRLR